MATKEEHQAVVDRIKAKKGARKKLVQRVVRGPRHELKWENKPAKEPKPAVDPGEGRTRVLFVEPPTKTTGNPFIALRVPKRLLEAFDAWAKTRKQTRNIALRSLMMKATNVRVEEYAEVEE